MDSDDKSGNQFKLSLITSVILFVSAVLFFFIDLPQLLISLMLMLSCALTISFAFQNRKNDRVNKQRIQKQQVQKTQLQQYIDASWGTNKAIIHEENILAIKYMMVGISHEMSTPLGNAYTSISVLENLLKADDLPKNREKVNSALELSIESIRRTIGLLDQLKVVSHSSTGEKIKNFHLKQLLYDIKEIKEHEWNKKPVDQIIECPDNLILKSYPYSLKMVLDVLLNNAQESIEGSQGEIHIRIEQEEDNLLIFVKDNGCGITAENIENIYDPFFTTSRNRKHLGLGLSMAQNLIVNLLKGELSAESEPGGGTVMKIYLPGIIEAVKVVL